MYGEKVYFARNPATGLIKIGVTTCVELRLSTLRRKGEIEPELLAAQDGTRRIEGRVHARLYAHHVGHEWFAPHEEVLAMAAGVKWGLIDLSALPDEVSPLRRNAAIRGHAKRFERRCAA